VMTSTTEACPEGITRQAILDLCEQHDIPREVGDIPLQDVRTADEVFCTGTMGELAPVTQIDQTRFCNGEAGTMTRRLSELYSVLTKSEGVQVV